MAGNDGRELTPARILSLVLQSLRGGEQTEATVRNAYEAIALVGHASMLAAGYRLVGLGEEHNIGMIASTSRKWIHEHSADLTAPIEATADTDVLPKEWNSQDTYAFRYRQPQSSSEYLLKVTRLGNNAVVFGLQFDEDKPTSFSLAVQDYVESSKLPLSLTEDAPERFKAIFTSESRLEDLISLFKVHVIQKYGFPKPEQLEEERRAPEPGVARVSEEAPRRDPLRDDQAPPPARPYPFNDPLAAAPRRPGPTPDFAPPDFEDEYQMNQPPRGYDPQSGRQGEYPRLGERDLYPPGLGPHDPLRGTFGPGFGTGGGGMHPTFDDPLFGGPQGGGYNPQAPPGSRYDPVGPWDTPPSGRLQRPGGRGMGPRGFGGGII